MTTLEEPENIPLVRKARPRAESDSDSTGPNPDLQPTLVPKQEITHQDLEEAAWANATKNAETQRRTLATLLIGLPIGANLLVAFGAMALRSQHAHERPQPHWKSH